MSLDWIRMRSDLYRDPKVIVMADLLLDLDGPLANYIDQNWQRTMTVTRNVMRNAVVGGLVSVWGVVRVQGVRSDNDLVLKNSHLIVVDDIADMAGFGHAMKHAGWVEEVGNTLVFPRFFEEYNSEHDDRQRQNNRLRQAKYREKQRNGSNVISNDRVTSQSNAREEKRREETKGKKVPKKRPSEYSEAFLGFWDVFAPRRRAKKADAWRAWQQMGCEAIAELVTEGAVAYAASPEGLGEFCAGPPPWLRGARWEDDRSSWMQGEGETSQVDTTRREIQKADIEQRKQQRAASQETPFRELP